MDFILQQVLFYISIVLVLFLPGYFLLNLIEAKRKYFSLLEKLVISVGLSITLVDFILIIIGRMGISINKVSVIFSIILLALLFQFIAHAIKKSYNKFHRPVENVIDKNRCLSFSKNQMIFIILILFLTIFIKTIYLQDAISPTATDLGHHVYWSKLIAETGQLPIYQEKDIVEINGNYAIGDPQKIADFIIGEHLILAAVSLASGANFVSSFPSLILFFINIIGILAVFILTFRLFEDNPDSKNIAIIALLLIGPLYAISSSQAKFVSGGVVGNIIGNLLIPLVFYFYFRSLREKNSVFLALAIFLTAGIFYTHHLSALIFLFVFAASLAIFVAFNIRSIGNLSREWFRLAAKPPVIITLLIVSCFLLVYLPSYIETSAVKTIAGVPTKSTKTGFSFTQLSYTVGEARMALGLAGLFIVFVLRKKKIETALLIGWIAAIFLMSWRPDWIHLNIPSARIANYLPFPLAITGAFALAWIFQQLQNRRNGNFYFNSKLLLSFGFLFLTFAVVSGFYENSQLLKETGNSKSVQTFNAARYLAEKTDGQDVVLKDHNFIPADSWMKIFFMRDYNYPLTRSFFFRYEENPGREHCTLNMISSPNLPEGQKCFNNLGVNFIAVNPAYDSAQFEKSEEFEKIYSSGNIVVYYRNQF